MFVAALLLRLVEKAKGGEAVAQSCSALPVQSRMERSAAIMIVACLVRAARPTANIQCCKGIIFAILVPGKTGFKLAAIPDTVQRLAVRHTAAMVCRAIVQTGLVEALALTIIQPGGAVVGAGSIFVGFAIHLAL